MITTRYVNWPDIDLTKYFEATHFGPVAEDGKLMLRGSVAPSDSNPANYSRVIDGKWLYLFIDYLKNLNTTGEIDHRREVTFTPWQIRLPIGTREIFSFVMRFPTNYRNDLVTPVSIVQFMSRDKAKDFSEVVLQLELSGENQKADGKLLTPGQIQIVHKSRTLSDNRSLRIGTEFVPTANEDVPVRIEVVHGISGYIKIELGGKVVYEVADQMAIPGFEHATAQFKLGVYHHALRVEKNGRYNLQRYIDKGHTGFGLAYSPLSYLKADPGEAIPNYHYAMLDPFREIASLTELRALESNFNELSVAHSFATNKINELTKKMERARTELIP